MHHFKLNLYPIKVKGIGKIAKQLDIDYADAVVKIE
jgi:hypothetical protein